MYPHCVGFVLLTVFDTQYMRTHLHNLVDDIEVVLQIVLLLGILVYFVSSSLQRI